MSRTSSLHPHHVHTMVFDALRAIGLSALIIGVLALLTVMSARAADVFDFIPSGGRTLLLTALGNRTAPDEARGLLAQKLTREQWQGYLRDHAKAVPGLQRLDAKATLTLADYLAVNMPLAAAKIPARPAQSNLEKVLPLDGRDMALEYCQSCHIITVVITQNRSKEAWLGTMNKPSHIQIKLAPEQRDALANYLVLNAAIPIDRVPEDLRAGGATY